MQVNGEQRLQEESRRAGDSGEWGAEAAGGEQGSLEGRRAGDGASADLNIKLLNTRRNFFYVLSYSLQYLKTAQKSVSVSKKH